MYIEKKNVVINGDIGFLSRDLREVERFMFGEKILYFEFVLFKDWYDFVVFFKSEEGIYFCILVNFVE